MFSDEYGRKKGFNKKPKLLTDVFGSTVYVHGFYGKARKLWEVFCIADEFLLNVKKVLYYTWFFIRSFVLVSDSQSRRENVAFVIVRIFGAGFPLRIQSMNKDNIE